MMRTKSVVRRIDALTIMIHYICTRTRADHVIG